MLTKCQLTHVLEAISSAVLLQTPNFNALSGVSLAAAFMSLSYSTIAFAGSLNVGQQPGKKQCFLHLLTIIPTGHVYTCSGAEFCTSTATVVARVLITVFAPALHQQ